MKWKEKGIASHDQPTSEERSTYFTFSEIQISPKEEMEVSSLFLIIKAKLTATTFHQQEKKMNIKFVMHRVKIYLNGLFSFYREFYGLWKWVFTKEKYPEYCATLSTPQKDSASSVLKTMWSFNLNKHIIFSTIYRLWLFRRKAFYRRCIPRSISIINDTAIVRNLYP